MNFLATVDCQKLARLSPLLKKREFSLAFGSSYTIHTLHTRGDLYQFLRVFRNQKAGQLGRLLDSYPTTLVSPLPIVRRPRPRTIRLDTLSATSVHLGLVQFAVFGEHPVLFFKRGEIETFVATWGRCVKPA